MLVNDIMKPYFQDLRVLNRFMGSSRYFMDESLSALPGKTQSPGRGYAFKRVMIWINEVGNYKNRAPES